MINLNDLLALLARRLPWDQIETAVAVKFERQKRATLKRSALDQLQVLERQLYETGYAALVQIGDESNSRCEVDVRLNRHLTVLFAEVAEHPVIGPAACAHVAQATNQGNGDMGLAQVRQVSDELLVLRHRH